MTLVLKDRVKETTATTGTDTYALAGAETGFEAFSSVGNGNTTYYCCTDGVDFEIGVGTYTLSGTTLARTTILQSSNSDAAFSWGAGSKIIFCTQPGEKAVYLDASNQLTLNGSTITSTVAELNILDGVTSTATELNILDGVTSTTAELNILDGVTSTTAELNILDGVTASATDINLIDGITNGTVIASKAIVTDANIDITGGRNITITGILDAATGDFSGNVDIDGTLEADAITVDGTALATLIAATTVTSATNATHVTVADNESTNEENLIPFIEDTSATGNVGLESDGDFAYNPSTGTVSATIFKGNIDAVDGDFDGTLEADAITLDGVAVTATATLSTGISNNNVPKFTSGVADDDFLKVNGTAIEGRSASEVLSDIGASAVAGSSSILTTGALDAGSITSNFGTINNGASTITTTGAVATGALTASGLVIAGAKLDLNGTELILDADADTSITADTDDQIDIRIAGADDFTFTANTFTALANSGVVIPDGGLTLGSTALTSTATELNQLDGKVAKTAGKESIWIPAGAMYPSTTNPCSDLTQVETTALRPDLKVLDFAAAADDFAQFSVAFPKSWNEGTITYQPFWTVTAGTNTGTVVWQLGGIAVTNDATINVAFPVSGADPDLTPTTALAHSGTSNDLMVSAESGAVTILGSPSTDDVCFFQINNDASASGQTGVVRLLGIKVFFTTDAANDA